MINSINQKGEEVFLLVKEILIDIGIPKEQITLDSKIREDLELDSVEIVDLIMGVKKKFKISLRLEDNKNLLLSKFCELIVEKINEKK